MKLIEASAEVSVNPGRLVARRMPRPYFKENQHVTY
jgi:hypothetical protein